MKECGVLLYTIKKKNKIILSRDRFGEKFLFFKKTKKEIIFGSEIKYIKKLISLKKLKINKNKIKDFLQFGYKILFKDNNTFFKDIYSLNSGTYIEIDQKLNIKQRRYWNYKKKINRKLKINEIIKKTKKKLEKSVELQLRSDVPVSLLLSGGIDSPILAGIIRKKYKKNLETFSIVDEKDKRYFETNSIKFLSKKLKLKSNFFSVSNKFTLNKLKKMTQYHDAPVITITSFMQNLLAEKIKKKKYKVCIGGSSADEIFTGFYDHYLMYLYETKKNKNIKEYNSTLKNWKKFILPKIRNENFKNYKLFINNPNERNYVYDHHDNLKKFFLKPKKNRFKEIKPTSSLLKNRLLNELFFENVPVYNHEGDLNFMEHSIELRSPFLSKDLYDFMQSVPDKYFMMKGYNKYILRKIGKEYLPNKIVSNRIKTAFNFSIFNLLNFKSKKIIDYVKKDSPIYKILNKKVLLDFFINNKRDVNYLSKFIFSFLSVKVFLDLNK